MVVGPKVTAGAKISEPIYLQDVMPTTLELAGVAKPNHVEFNSLLPMLRGGKSPYDKIYGAYLDMQRSIRTDKYKLIAYPKAKVLRLYDIQSDPLEKIDLANDESKSGIIAGLFEDLLELQKSMNDKTDLSALAPALAPVQ